MSSSTLALSDSSKFPIKHVGNVHVGKVRAVYWLTEEDSARLIKENGYAIHPSAQLGVMIITDKISAFDSNWQAYGPNGEDIVGGVPGKGATLNLETEHWFDLFKKTGIGNNHILEAPHPLMWIVQKAEPVMIEGILRDYITGSGWRTYKKGSRKLCGLKMPEGLVENQRLPGVWYTPTTKGILEGIPGVPATEDAKIDPVTIIQNYKEFGLKKPEDAVQYEHMCRQGFDIISKEADKAGEIFVDTKFEIGYILTVDGEHELIYIDEVGTTDSSRFWSKAGYQKFLAGELKKVPERSKEGYRVDLKKWDEIPDIRLLIGGYNTEEEEKQRVPKLKAWAKEHPVPWSFFKGNSETNYDVCKSLTGSVPRKIDDAHGELTEIIGSYGLLVKG